MDAVVAELKRVSPSLEGTVWERTPGNELDVSGGDPASWLLPVPDLWGRDVALPGGKPEPGPGVLALARKLETNIAQAQRCVDISGFGVADIRWSPGGPFANGLFLEAMVNGLRTAAQRFSPEKKLLVRYMTGVMNDPTADPRFFYRDLRQRIGPTVDRIELAVAAMTTRGISSYNHTKFVLVDGLTVVHGGVNWMASFYHQDGPGDSRGGGAPVTDLDMALRGPAAFSAGLFLDFLWRWMLKQKLDDFGDPVVLATRTDDSVLETMRCLYPEKHRPVGKADGLTVLAVGSLGYGVKEKDPKSEYQPPSVADIDGAACANTSPVDQGDGDGVIEGLLRSWGVEWESRKANNETNTDRDFMTVNPDASALQALVRSAKNKIVLVQQDISGFAAFPLFHAKFDVRMFDILAAKLLNGVKVRIVVSNPGPPDYSNIYDIVTETAKPLFGRVLLLAQDVAAANQAMKNNLQLAPLRGSDTPTWANGHKYRLHSKVVSVDDTAFYLGSRNVYPDTTQDHGFIIDDVPAATQLKDRFLDPAWRYSKNAAIYNYTDKKLVTPVFALPPGKDVIPPRTSR
jgi:phosphatidylserine/phosphatidylglycerophosphate/cardiolipin synthase-like enzyme